MKHIRSLILAFVFSAGLAPAFAQAPAPVPALPDTERRTSYVISGTTCACAVGFQLYQDSTDVQNWVKVYLNGVEVPQSGNWNITSASGSIGTLARPITDGVLTFTAVRTGTVQIVGAQRPRRLSEFSENRGVAARDLNQVLNGIEAQLREMWDRQFRTVQAPPGDTLALLPLLANRTSMGACFDSGGNLTSCVSVPSSTFAAGNGITLSGVGPTTIAANLAATAPIVMAGTSLLTFSCPTCVTGNVVTSIAGNTGPFTLSGGVTNSGNDIRLANNSATLVGAPANPPNTSSTSGDMAGFGVSTCRIAPVYSTRMEVTFYGQWSNNTSSQGIFLEVRTGTGAGPTNGSAPIGTQIAGPIQHSVATSNFFATFSLTTIVNGLTPATTYWFDISRWGSANSTILANVKCVIREF